MYGAGVSAAISARASSSDEGLVAQRPPEHLGQRRDLAGGRERLRAAQRVAPRPRVPARSARAAATAAMSAGSIAAIATSGHGARTTSPWRSCGSQRSALDWKPLGRRIVERRPDVAHRCLGVEPHARDRVVRPAADDAARGQQDHALDARPARSAATSPGMSLQPPSRNTASAPSSAGVSDSGSSRSPATTSTPAARSRAPARARRRGPPRPRRQRRDDLAADVARCAR